LVCCNSLLLGVLVGFTRPDNLVIQANSWPGTTISPGRSAAEGCKQGYAEQ
jgi:hypothetical protein